MITGKQRSFDMYSTNMQPVCVLTVCSYSVLYNYHIMHRLIQSNNQMKKILIVYFKKHCLKFFIYLFINLFISKVHTWFYFKIDKLFKAYFHWSNVALCPQKPWGFLGRGSPGQPPWLSHSSWAQPRGKDCSQGLL